MSRLVPMLSVALLACANPSGPAGTYAEVEPVFETACTFSGCHGGRGPGAAQLNFESGGVYDSLVGVTSCEYDALPRVEPLDPEGSWLWIKLTRMHDADGWLDFTPAPTWDPGIAPDGEGMYPASECPLTDEGQIRFGERMPMASDGGLDVERLAIVRAWIENGAPGPEE